PHSSSTGDHLDLPSFPTRRSSDLGRGGFLGAFLGLDLLPALFDGRLVEARQIERAVQVAVGEDMRMTPDQLVGDRIDHRGEIETDRKSTRLNSSHVKISYAVFCLK